MKKIKYIVFILSLLPFGFLVFYAFTNQLGANPVETLTDETGLWTLRFLLFGLAITPLRFLFNWGALIKLRRLLGLFAFFYASLHFVTYLWFDQFFDWQEILLDIPKRPFITLGFVTFVLLLLLAITSTNKMQRRLKHNWLLLHRLVYVIPVLVIIHFIWSLKADYREPFIYASIFLLLMFIRIYKHVIKKVN